MRRAGPARRRRAGFTLIELLAVVGVIALLSVMAVGGYTGIMRALSENAAADGLRRAVMLARQQACVEGVDLWVWPTGEDRFVIIRKLGTVVDRDSGQRTPSYFKTRKVSSQWVHDPYADMEDTGSALSGADGLSDEAYQAIADKFVARFSSQYLFDLENQVLAVYEYPPWYDETERAWIFGVKSAAGANLSGQDFEIGTDYGVVVQPEQFLAKGYLFEGSVDQDGDFNPAWAKRNAVHVKPDGTVAAQRVFELSDGSESENRTKTTVTVKTDGSVEVK